MLNFVKNYAAIALAFLIFTSPAVAQADAEASIRFAVTGNFGSGGASIDECNVVDLVESCSPDCVITIGDKGCASSSMDTAAGKYYCDFPADGWGRIWLFSGAAVCC